jgi:hypothetical protein
VEVHYSESSLDSSTMLILEEQIASFRNEFSKRASGFSLPNIRVEQVLHSRNVAALDNSFVVSLPVCNQDKLISKTLAQLFKNIDKDCTLVIILDACHDLSKKHVLEFLTRITQTNFINTVVLLETKDDLFESTCENLALAITDSQYFVSMQADIMFDDASILSRVEIAFNHQLNLLGISSRAILPATNANSPRFSRLIYKAFGAFNALTSRLFNLVHLPPFITSNYYLGDVSKPPADRMHFFNWQKNTIYLGDTLIRGPIFWRTKYLNKLGGFNDVKYPLGGDERELCILGKEKFSFEIGYLPSTCYSNVWTGTSHNSMNRTLRTVQNLEARNQLQETFDEIFDFKLSEVYLNGKRRRTLKLTRGFER